MINDSRKEQLAKAFIFNADIDSLMVDELDIQEIIFLINTCKKFLSEQDFDSNVLDKRIDYFTDLLSEQILEAPTLYVLYDKATSYLFYNEKDAVEIFSKEEFAENALEFYNSKQYRRLYLKTISQDEYSYLFGEVYRLGLRNVMIDNGQFSYIFKVEDLAENPYLKDGNAVICLSSVNEACIKYFTQARWAVDFKGKAELLKIHQDKMIKAIKEAKFIIPIKHNVFNKNEEEVTIHFAKLENKATSQFYLPLFTDWVEFERLYDKNSFDGMMLSFEDASNILKGNGYDGLVLNPTGINFVIQEDLIKTITLFK